MLAFYMYPYVISMQKCRPLTTHSTPPIYLHVLSPRRSGLLKNIFKIEKSK